MNKEEILNKFDLINGAVIASKNNAKMEIANSVFHKTLCKLADYDLSEAQSIVDCYEGKLKFNNYLTEKEAVETVNRFKGDSFNGGKWQPEPLFKTVVGFNGKVEEEPYYNKWSLFTVMNMYASDHDLVIKELSDGETDKYAMIAYRFAESTLKDVDRPNWVRDYFKL